MHSDSADKRPNHAIERTADPRHASCVRTCRATGRGPLIAIVGAKDQHDNIQGHRKMISRSGCLAAIALLVSSCQTIDMTTAADFHRALERRLGAGPYSMTLSLGDGFAPSGTVSCCYTFDRRDESQLGLTKVLDLLTDPERYFDYGSAGCRGAWLELEIVSDHNYSKFMDRERNSISIQYSCDPEVWIVSIPESGTWPMKWRSPEFGRLLREFFSKHALHEASHTLGEIRAPTMPSSVSRTSGTPPAGQEPRRMPRSAHG